MVYRYTFTKENYVYHVYAESKVDAIKCYVEENELEELPTNLTITRYNE